MRCHVLPLATLIVASMLAFTWSASAKESAPATMPKKPSIPVLTPQHVPANTLSSAAIPLSPAVAVDSPQHDPDETHGAAPAETARTESANPGGEKWRFRQHQGMWWYWLPSEKWVYWHEGQWTPYDAATYAALRRSLPTRRYSYYRGRAGAGRSDGGYPELGEWGRVRYDGYGNRQYPYSMRRSGIRQLGPVPAMGGVRSLPGWGGER